MTYTSCSIDYASRDAGEVNTPLVKRFGSRVRSLRQEKEWSQETLCERSGISTEHLSRIENGLREVCLNNIGKLAACFGISISDLMRGI